MNSGARGQEEGFALLEFLASFAIFAMSLSALIVAFASAMRADRRSKFVSVATLQATSILNMAGSMLPLTVRRISGRFENGNEWVLISVPLADNRDDRRSPLEAFRIEARVSDSSSDDAPPVIIRRIEVAETGPGS